TRMSVDACDIDRGAAVDEVTPDQLVGDLGEHQLIDVLTRRLEQNESVLVGPGDDAAVIATPDARCVVSTDLMVEGKHFKREWSRGHDVGRRLAGANLSDICAMGADPTALVVGLVLPATTTVAWVLDFADGLVVECRMVNAAVVGGDLSGGAAITVAATALGDLGGRDAVRRAGAKPGDVVALAGRVGWAAAGLFILGRGFTAPRALVAAHRFPEPPYAAGKAAALAGATSMIDVSDGLVADIGHLARASGAVMAVSTDSLPVDAPVQDAASAFNADPMDWILTGGDDHGLVATFPPGIVMPEGFRPIGVVEELARRSPEVLVDGAQWQSPGGFDHFS
ncbi:MAG: thiamine-phosphate kinase, partial [Candidatus Nanopelagicales bacterium]